MPRPTDHDPRESPKHRHLLGIRGSLPYLPHALAWAFSIEVLSLVIIYGAVLGIFAGYLTALWIVMLLGSGALAWLLAVVARAIWGFGDPPRVDAQQLITVGAGALRVAVLVVLMLAGYQFLSGYSLAGAQWFAWVCGALFPSALILLAVDEDLFKALNPVRQLRVLVFGGALGWVLAVCSAWLVYRGLGAVALVLADIKQLAAIQAAPPTGGRILGGIGGLWGAAFLLHWYGHALHHRHARAGLGIMLDAASDEELEAGRCERAIASRVETVARLLAAGDTVGARRVVESPGPEDVDPLAFHTALWQQFLQHKMFAAAVKAAVPLLDIATTRKLYPLASEVWFEARRHSPSFDPGEAVRARLRTLAEAHNDARVLAMLQPGSP